MRSAKLLAIDEYQFKDFNKNGSLDIHEDWRLSTEERVEDLMSQMNLEEKAGFMPISSIAMNGEENFSRGQGDGEVIMEIEDENTQTIIATFGTTLDALLDVVSGRFNPTGKMPITIPVSKDVV